MKGTERPPPADPAELLRELNAVPGIDGAAWPEDESANGGEEDDEGDEGGGPPSSKGASWGLDDIEGEARGEGSKGRRRRRVRRFA